jgi:hypothetical protein
LGSEISANSTALGESDETAHGNTAACAALMHQVE